MFRRIVLLTSILFMLGVTSGLLAQVTVFTEDFGIGSFDKSQWVETYNDGASNYFLGSTNIPSGTSGYSARLEDYRYETDLTMADGLDTTGATEINITFWTRRSSSGGTNHGKIHFNEEQSPTTFTEYATYTPTANTWVQQSVTLTDSKYMFDGFKVRLSARTRYSDTVRYFWFDEVTVTATYPVISGSVGSVEGVTMSGLPGDPVTDQNGDYSATVDNGWSGTVTPTKLGYTFTPSSKNYSNVTSDHTDQDYIPSYNIVDVNMLGRWFYGSQDANDISGYARDGTMHGGADIVSDAEMGYVLDLDGVDSYVSIPNFTYTHPTTHNCSLIFWFKIQQESSYFPYMFNHGPEFDQNNFDVYMRKSQDTTDPGAVTTRIQVDGEGSRIQENTSARYDDNEWHAYAAIKSGTTLSVYIDGQLDWTGSIPGDAAKIEPASGYDIFLGARRDTTTQNIERFLTGRLYDVRLYDKALTTAEIADLAGVTYTISGNVGTLEGVTMDGLPGDIETDEYGDYSATVDYGWSGVVTPQKEGYTFSPEERLYDNITSDYANQDYTPSLMEVTISGYVGMIEGVEMVGLPGTPETDETGFYVGTVDYGWSGTVTPTKTNAVFQPSQRVYSNVIQNKIDQDYTSIADTGLIGWWPFNGDANDYSGYGNNGTITGAEFVYTEGKGIVLDFDGADYVSIPAAALSMIDDEITVSLWQFGDSAEQPQDDVIFRADNSSGDRLLNSHLPWGSGKVYWDAGYSGGYDRISQSASTEQYESQWNHWVFTKDATAGIMKIYCNGELFNSENGKTRSMAGVDQFCIGSKSDGTMNYDGMISNFRVYDRVLSDTEIYGLYTASYTASNPSPADLATDVPTDSTLSWTAGYLAADVNGHDVYFGTSWADVNEANDLVHMGLQSDTTFDPGILQGGITYFWAVHEVNDLYANSPWQGPIWSFTTRDANLVGWWPLDGDANDHSGNGYDGSVTGAEFIFDGGKGTVLDFDGADYVSVPSSVFSSISDKVTICLWQYGDSALQPQDDSIFYAADSSGNRVIQAHVPWGSGTVYLDAGNSGSSYDRISKSASPDQYEGKWNHWTFTKDATTGIMKMYCNGELFESGTGKTLTMTGITQFKIGSKYDGTNNYDGMVCDFRVYDKVLSQSEISDIYESSQVYIATNPFPCDGTQNVPTNVYLNWTPGSFAADVNGHDVYFGTSFEDVNSGLPAVHMGLQSDTTYYTGVLDYNTTYYWAVDEVNDLEGDSPWLGEVWSFKTWPEYDLPAMPTDVQNTNTRLMLGDRRGVVFPIKWADDGCDYTYSQCVSGAQSLSDLYYEWSRGRVQMVFSSDGSGDHYEVYHPDDCEVPYNKVSSNESLAHQYLINQYNIPSSHIKWFIQSGNSTPNAGGTTCDTRSPQTFTISHEMGHLFRLAHGCELEYNPDGTFYQNDRYGDRTTNMGRSGAGGFNLPQMHRLKWIDEDEVAVFQREDSGTVYRIRDIHLYEDVNLAGVVYYLPHTGNRLWIALTNKSTNDEQYLGSDYALSKYVMGWHSSSNMEETICITQFVGEHTDDFGLTYELVELNTTEKWADIRITYNPANERRVLPLIFNQTQRLLQAPGDGVRGQMEVTIEITNPNPDTTVPFVNQRSDNPNYTPKYLVVPNSYDVDNLTKLTNILPGGTTQTCMYLVKSQKGPLSPEEAHLTGSFQIAHRLPFEFSIDFE